MSGTTFSDEILETNSGTVTAWLPLSTPWLSIQACSSQIYAQRAGLGANLIAFDPLYGLEISASAIPCLPSEASAWYMQTQNSLTTTLLGPTFVCPGAYSAVETILINSYTQQILCCPSQYSLNVPLLSHATFPSQCVSMITSGQTLAFETTLSSNSGWQPATITEQSASVTVYGIHVNGFNVIQTSSSSPTGTSPTSSLQSQITQIMTGNSTSSSSSSTGTSAASSGSSSPPAGTNKVSSKVAAAGIGAGATIGVLAVIAGFLLLYRRWKGRKPVQVEFKPLDPGPGPYEVDGRKVDPELYEADGGAGFQGKSYPPYEMATTKV